MAEQPRDERDERSVFLAALEKTTPQERDAFVQEACAGDRGLLERIKELLAAHEAPDGPFDSSPPGLNATLNPPITEQPGTVIGPYRLIQQIGEGGMGVVYLAEQTEPVERRVALKIIKPGMDTRQVIARFEAEEQALAIMDHPSIAKVLDAGATDSGRPYFVMELVRGVAITKYCDEHRLAPRERLELFVPVCQAVQHAHQKGIIHRDIKPSNVLIALYDDRPIPKIIDFGVAKATGQRLTEKTVFTQYGQIVGTLEYMSPEQANMSPLDIDTRSDIYSLGVLLYELLTGVTPFDRQRLRSAAFDEMLRIIREEEPPKPSTRLSTIDTLPSVAANRHVEPKRLRSLVRGELDWIVMKALEKDRARRYETANGFASDILRYLSDEPVAACPPSRSYRFRKFARRNRVALVTTLMVAAALVVGIIGTTWQLLRAIDAERLAQTRYEEAEVQRMRAGTEAARANQEAARAEEEADKARTEAAIARAVNEFINNDLLAQADPGLEPDRDIKLREVLDRTSTNIEGRFEGQPLVEAGIRHTLSTTYRALGEYDQAERHADRARQLRHQVWGEGHADTLTSMNLLGLLYLNQGRYEEAEATLQKTLQLRCELLGAEHPDSLISQSNVALLHYDRGRLEQAEPLFVETLAAQRRVHGAGHSDTLATANSLALLYKARGRYEEAVSLYRETLEALRHSLGEQHPHTLTVMGNLAGVYQSLGRHEEATAQCEQVLQARRQALGSQHPNTLTAMNNLAQLYKLQSRYEEAEPLYQEALEGYRRTLGERHPGTLSVMSSLAALYLACERYSEAQPLFEQVLQVRLELLGDEHRDTLTAMNNLASLYRAQGRHDEARPLYERALVIMRKVMGERHPNTVNLMNNLALLYKAQKRYDDAQAMYQEALEIMRDVLGEEHPNTLNLMQNLGSLYVVQGRFGEAQALYEKILEAQRQKPGPTHPTTLSSMANLAMVYMELDRSADAIRLFQEVTDGRLASSTPSRVLAFDMYHLAVAYLSLSDTENYQRVCRQMLEVLGSEQGLPDAHLAAWTCILHPQATNDWAPVLALARQTAQQHPESVSCANTLGAALWRAGDANAAIEVLEEIAKRLDDPTAAEEVPPGCTWFVLALAYQQQGDTDKARQWFEKAADWMAHRWEQHQSADGPKVPWDQRSTLQQLRDEAAGKMD